MGKFDSIQHRWNERQQKLQEIDSKTDAAIRELKEGLSFIPGLVVQKYTSGHRSNFKTEISVSRKYTAGHSEESEYLALTTVKDGLGKDQIVEQVLNEVLSTLGGKN